MHLHIAFNNGGCSFDEFYMLDLSVDRRFIRQIDPLEFDPMINRCRGHPQADLRPGMQ